MCECQALSTGKDFINYCYRSSAKDSTRIKIPAGRVNLDALPKNNLTQCIYSTLRDAYREFGEHPLHHLRILCGSRSDTRAFQAFVMRSESE